MRYVATAVFSVIAVSVSLLAEGPATTESDPTSQRDRSLYAFCQTAILRERGIARSPFLGSTDKWILEKLVPDVRFLAALDASRAVAFSSSLDRRMPIEAAHSKTDEILIVYQRNDEYSSKLISKLTVEQRARLPAVYLHIEGLLAVCRPEFSEMFENLETRDKIRRLTEKMWRERAAPLHQTLFGLQTVDESPIYEVELRRVSAELDWAIVQLLSDVERTRILDVVSKSRSVAATL